jgi:serine/threonine protein kinase/Tfp pilus assembly protein PilF
MNSVFSSEQLQPLRLLAVGIKREWTAGSREPDAQAALRLHPELASVKTIVLDLAYEEYCRRRQRGETVDPDEFCERFPRFRAAVRKMIDAHHYLAENPGKMPDVLLDPWPNEGENISGFTILRQLGRGAFARVYLATEESAGDRPVALKLTFEGGSEACILGRLTHPNVVHVNSSGEDEETGLTRLCMPFLGAATLHDLLRRAYPEANAAPPARAAVILETVAHAVRPNDPRPYIEPGLATPPEVLRTGSYADGVAELGRQIASALAFVHNAGVHHRDLKPSNVLLAPGGRPVLLDFNLSNDARFAGGRLGGTLPYMAPEQVQAALDGDLVPEELDGRADLFSLGVILYELLAGRLPFSPMPPHDAAMTEGGPVLLAAQQAGYTGLTKLHPGISPRLAGIVERCLSLQPGKRPGDAAELADELNDYLIRKILAPRRRRRWAYAVSAAILLTAGTLAAGQLLSHQEQPAPRVQTPFELGREKMLAGEDDLAILAFRHAEKLRVAEGSAPDGLTLACVAFCTARGRQYDSALFDAQKAREAGFETAAVYNNEGVALQSKGNVEAAYIAFSEAIQRDPGLREPYHNRIKLWMQCHSEKRPNVPPLDEARRDASRALTLGQPTAELLYDAAILGCLAGDTTQAWDYLQHEEARNIPAMFLVNRPGLALLRSRRQDFPALVALASKADRFPVARSYLVDPAFGLDK